MIIVVVSITKLDFLEPSVAFGHRANINTLPNGKNYDDKSDNSKKQSGRSVKQLPLDGLGLNADAGGTRDAKDEKPVAEINASGTNTSTNSLENVAPPDRVIRIDVINHVVFDKTPNVQKLSHAAGDSRQPETRSEN